MKTAIITLSIIWTLTALGFAGYHNLWMGQSILDLTTTLRPEPYDQNYLMSVRFLADWFVLSIPAFAGILFTIDKG